MPTDNVEAFDGPVTVIGLFPVATSEQDQLVDAINETGKVMRSQPGFLGSSVFTSLDGTRVIISSRWESVAALKAAREDPE
ncbi:MAG TPA: antibiotic biosynthesis monooxygenase family protein, partial [Umezawaea sp.]|nr:antibiotic biosynthesis monooxygenase family protein [Umezawaea sp.]